MRRETLDKFIRKEVTLTFKDGEIAKGTLEYDKYHSNKYVLLRPTEESDICFPSSLVKSIGSFGLYEKLKEQRKLE